jgi:BioD-like phosphotransacetylase family protein
LIITPAHREEIILAILAKFQMEKNLNIGMILTGQFPPRNFVVEELKKAHIPVFHVPLHSDEVLEKINSFTAKIQKEDNEKIQEAIHLIEKNIDFDLLLKLLS